MGPLGYSLLFLYGGVVGVIGVCVMVVLLGWLLFTVRGDGTEDGSLTPEKKARAAERKMVFSEVRASNYLPEAPHAFVKPVNEYEYARWGQTQRPSQYDREIERLFQDPDVGVGIGSGSNNGHDNNNNTSQGNTPYPNDHASNGFASGIGVIGATGVPYHRKQSLFGGAVPVGGVGQGIQNKKPHGLLDGKGKFNYKINVTVVRAEDLVGANKNGWLFQLPRFIHCNILVSCRKVQSICKAEVGYAGGENKACPSHA